jgi:predicted ArsR family transcriptional regulator
MGGMRSKRDLVVTLYRILLYLSRMRYEERDTKRLVRVSRAVGIERKELRSHLEKLEHGGLVERIEDAGRGRGGHPLVHWDISEAGRVWRSDLGRLIQLGQRLEYYPESFFYLPSDSY